MSQKPSRLSTPINFDAPGKQCDYVRLPHSVHRSAYGWLAIPIVCHLMRPGRRVADVRTANASESL